MKFQPLVNVAIQKESFSTADLDFRKPTFLNRSTEPSQCIHGCTLLLAHWRPALVTRSPPVILRNCFKEESSFQVSSAMKICSTQSTNIYSGGDPRAITAPSERISKLKSGDKWWNLYLQMIHKSIMSRTQPYTCWNRWLPRSIFTHSAHHHAIPFASLLSFHVSSAVRVCLGQCWPRNSRNDR